jgi:acetoacetate decarboxylase
LVPDAVLDRETDGIRQDAGGDCRDRGGAGSAAVRRRAALSVEFLSEPEFVAAVLPPPLEAVEEPRMRAMVGRWASNGVGDFSGGTIYVAARHEGIAGEYQLAQFIDGDVPLIYGRELFGEPKKLGAG